MKKLFALVLAGLLSVVFVLVSFAEESVTEALEQETVQSVNQDGLERPDGGSSNYWLTEQLTNFYEMEPVDGFVYFQPPNPNPLCIFVVAHPDCQIGINQDGIYYVTEKGFKPQSFVLPGKPQSLGYSGSNSGQDKVPDNMCDRITQWRHLIEKESDGLLRFVDHPDKADILLSINETYPFFGTYYGSGITSDGHSCKVTMTAYQLTDPSNTITISRQRDPEQNVTTSGGARFWKDPPEFEDTQEITDLVNAMLSWYGFGTSEGSYGDGVKFAQDNLIRRGYLEGTADGSFGPMTGEAVKKIQESCGLEPTGTIDGPTLIAIYYNQEAVDEMIESD